MIERPLEVDYHESGKLVLGMDEAGRGPLCGPLMVAGVIFPIGYQNALLDDSKKLSEKKRETLYKQIIEDALYWKVLVLSEAEIDELNIYRASQTGMERIAQEFSDVCDVVLSDAMPLPAFCKNHSEHDFDCPVKGDSKSISIAAASILAKVSRDHYMKKLDEMYPQYDLAKNKGYPTTKHLEAIKTHGVQDFYRRSFSPVAKVLKQNQQESLF